MIKIEVKQIHINKGKTGSIYCCPIALAIYEKFKIKPKLEGVEVGANHIKVSSKYYTTPRSCARFMRKFDEDGKKAVKPFNFLLRK